MKFNKEEVDRAINEDPFAPLPDGDYECEVLECEDTISKKGDPMFALKLAVVDPNSTIKRHIYDYISPNWFQQKFKAFFESMGQLPMYESGDIDAALLIGQYVTATLFTEPAGDYPAKNSVRTYVLAEVANARRSPAVTPANDTGLPF